MAPPRLHLLAALVIAGGAFALGQAAEGLGVVAALLGTTGWTAFAVARSRGAAAR